ncbi:hypothetical protein NNG62_11325 [Enterococcus faecium]|nr:hypothetical protein [Enterococcus faecium]MDT6388510.1 hypothetical protein [Enterococcus faecium]MDT6404540.1 hypothetical protein [Enterococcus faecium]MDT6410955.1 hypothetical protein [Enterococcus faecium]MDT6444749.1 hypothetical protein [Enterococcus faecium]
MKYRKKPVIIEAVQFNRSKAEKDVAKYYPMVTDMARLTTAKGTEEREDRFFISTLECNITVKDGDYIIQGADDEFYLRKPYIFEKIYEVASQQPKLNENQQIVLEWLKSETILTREAPILSVNAFSDKNLLGKLPNKVRKAYKLLDCKQEYEVLAAFAQWGLEQEEAE